MKKLILASITATSAIWGSAVQAADLSELSVGFDRRSNILSIETSSGNSIPLARLTWQTRIGQTKGPKPQIRTRSVPAGSTVKAFGPCAAGIQLCEDLEVEIPAGSDAIKIDSVVEWDFEDTNPDPLVFEFFLEWNIDDTAMADTSILGSEPDVTIEEYNGDDEQIGITITIGDSQIKYVMPGIPTKELAPANLEGVETLNFVIDGPTELRVDGKVVPGIPPVISETESGSSIIYTAVINSSSIKPSRVVLDPYFQLRTSK